MHLPDLYLRLRPLLEQQSAAIYLVGGAVRDAIMGIESDDLDFAVAKDAIKIARSVANMLDEPFYVLDRERDVGRVVLQQEKCDLDFARFRSNEGLEADLCDRDFTLNALALDLEGNVIDPTNGRADIANRLVRMTHPNAITNDPVRAIRAIRMAAVYDFSIDPETDVAIRDGASQLQTVSGERIRDAFLKTIGGRNPQITVSLLEQYGVLPAILPEIQSVPPLFNTLTRYVNNCQQFDEDLPNYMYRLVDGGFTGRQLIFLSALLSNQTNMKIVDKRLRLLKLSRAAMKHVQKTLLASHYCMSLETAGTLSHRDIYRYFLPVGIAGLDGCLLARAANHISARQAEQLINAWFTLPHVINPPPLINGRDIMELGIMPGAEIGTILATIREEQAAGTINSRAAAVAYAHQLSSL